MSRQALRQRRAAMRKPNLPSGNRPEARSLFHYASPIMSPANTARNLASLKLAGVAVLVGAAAGAGAILFWFVVAEIQGLLYAAGPTNLHSAAAGLPWWQLLLVPAVGGLAIGQFVHRYMIERRPQGVADVIEAAALRGGHLSPRNGLAAALVSAASIGCGASVGREGPIVHLGATLGSWLARRLRIPQGQVRRLIGCGVAAGIAASFNAPIAGAVFAIEVVIGKYTLHSFAPVAISTVIGTSVSRLYYGSEPAFSIPEHAATSLAQIPVYALLGILSAGVAIAFLRSVELSQDLFERLRCPARFRPALAGIGVGALAIVVPQVLGVGYETTSLALDELLSLELLLAILLAKLIASGLCLGGGFGGGVFSPSLFLGAMVGGAFGVIFESIYPEASAGYSAYTIVGMGAVAGAVLGAPLSTTLIVFEMTGDYALTLAVMLATITSSILVNDVWGRTFFRWQLERRGIELSFGQAEQLAGQLRMAELMSRDVALVALSATRDEIAEALGKGAPVYVVDDKGRFAGMIGWEGLWGAGSDATAADIAEQVAVLSVDDDLVRAITLSGLERATAFPVVPPGDEGGVAGFVTVKKIMNAYQGVLDRVVREERSFGD